jgi:hypothetical protein
MAGLEMVHREARGTDLRYPHLAVAASGRLAIFWSELRAGRTVPVASVSNDGGASWSRPVVFEAAGGGDSDRVRGAFARLAMSERFSESGRGRRHFKPGTASGSRRRKSYGGDNG